MRTFIVALIMLLSPNFLLCQTNELFKILKWNSLEQQKRLIAWYDLQDKTTIRLSTNTPNGVYSIDDKSVWKNNIKQPESSFQPLLKVDNGFINGEKIGLSFANGGFMTYYFSSEKYVSAITSFVVCRNDIGGSKLLFDLSYDGGEGVASCYSGLYKIESRVPNSLAQFEPDFSNNPSKILLLSTKGSSGKIKSYLNEVSYLGPGSRNFQGTSYNRIRLSTPSGVAPTDGTLYELILFDYELNDEEFNSVKKYLEKKYIFKSKSNNGVSNSAEFDTPYSSLIEGNSKNTQSKSSSSTTNNLLNAYSQLLRIAEQHGVDVSQDSENSIKNCECCRKRFSTRGYNIRKTDKQIIDASYYAGKVAKPVFCSRICASNFIKNNCR